MAIFGKKTNDEQTQSVPATDTKKEKTVKKTTPKTSDSMKDLYEEKTTASKTGKKTVKHGRAFRVLVKPLVTEKASVLGMQNKYVFSVDMDANKIEVAKAIEEVYGIKPVSVNIVRVTGKKVRHGKIQGKRKDFKKAVITLPKGKTIKVYEGV